MKKVNIVYWIATGIIVALMLFSAISSFMSNPEGAKMMDQLGYKPYLIHFLAIAKILGAIAILTPGFSRLKEWAYAGFAFDLIGATYSMYATGVELKNWAPILVFIAILFVSYIYHYKRLKLKASGVTDVAV